MRRKNSDSKALQDYYETNCPACGKLHRAIPGDRDRLRFKCKGCTTRFEIVLRRLSQEDLEQRFLEEDTDSGGWIF